MGKCLTPQGSLSELDDAVVVFGVFDGLHRGHRYLIDNAAALAQSAGKSLAALTFDVDPAELFSKNPSKIYSNEERLHMLQNYGIDRVVALRFDNELSSCLPQAFLDAISDVASPFAIFCGEDIRFGAKASGTIETLRTWCADQGIGLHPFELLMFEDEPITATRIRGLLQQGRIEKANELLGQGYHFKGTVEAGKGLGTSLGFATANIDQTVVPILLAEGVYGGCAYIDGTAYRAAICLGESKVFEGQNSAPIEVHVIGWNGSLNGTELLVEPQYFIRPFIDFETPAQLIETVKENIRWVAEDMPFIPTS